MAGKSLQNIETASAAGFTAGPAAVEVREGPYVVRFARTGAELDAALRLRFEVFNLELEEGLEASFSTGRDRDAFDATCHHLMIFHDESNEAVGTYRLQTSEIASAGFYSAAEFDLSRLPAGVVGQSVELGRACIAREHRCPQVLFLLWKGLGAYLRLTRKRYLFGCCSLTSQDPREGEAVLSLLEEGGHLHRDFFVPPQPGYACRAESMTGGGEVTAEIPRLFRTYLRFGAKACGPPAIDRLFKTIDFFVIFDLADLDLASRAFFGA